MRNSLALAEAFVITKDENPILPDRPSGRPAELVAAERRFLEAVGIFKKIGGVQRAVAQELIHASVKLIGARARNRVDDAARSEAVLRGIVAGQDRELLDRIHTQVLAQHAARPGVGVVIDDHAVQTIGILRRPVASDAELHSQPARV